MVVHVDVRHVGGLVPLWLSWHVVCNHLSIDGEVLEADVLHHATLVISSDDAHVWHLARIGDIAQGDVLNATARSGAILLVEANSHVDNHALSDVVDMEVLEGNALHQDVVAIVDADAALIVFLESRCASLS